MTDGFARVWGHDRRAPPAAPPGRSGAPDLARLVARRNGDQVAEGLAVGPLAVGPLADGAVLTGRDLLERSRRAGDESRNR